MMRFYLKKKLTVAALALVVLAGCASNPSSTCLIKEAPAPTLKEASALTKGNVIAVSRDSAVSGFFELTIADANGQRIIAYLSQDRKELVVGSSFNVETGKNITFQRLSHAQKERVASEGASNKMSQDNLHMMKGAAQIVYNASEESKGDVLIAIDPRCAYCHKAWGQVDALVADGSYTVYVILSAMLGEQSAVLGAKILSNSEPKAALGAVMGGSVPLGETDVESFVRIRAEVLSAASVLQGVGLRGVPVFVLPDREVIMGYAPNIFSRLLGEERGSL